MSLTSGRMLEFALQNGCGVSYSHSGAILAQVIKDVAAHPDTAARLREGARQALISTSAQKSSTTLW